MVTVKTLRTIFALFLAFSCLGQAYPAAAALDSWTAIGPGFGSIFTIAINHLEPNILYAGTVGGGIFKSTNSGQAWTAANTGLTDTIVYALAVDSGMPDTVYAGTRDPNTASSGGVFKSTNAGGSWAVTGLNNINYVNALAVDPKTSGTVYAGTYGKGVFKSTKYGQDWSPVNKGLTDASVYALAIDPKTPDTLYAGTKSGVFKSINAGDTWKPVFADKTYIAVYAIAIDPQNSKILYAGTVDPNGSNGAGGIFRSPDGGKTWDPVKASNPGPYIRSLAIDPIHPEIVYAGTGDPTSPTGSAYIYKSINSGTDWKAVWTGANDTSALALAIDPATPGMVYAGLRRHGMIKSLDGGQDWSRANSGLNNTKIYALAIDPTASQTMYAGTWNGVFKTTDLGQNWNLVFVGPAITDIHALAIDPQTPETLYAGTGSGLYKSKNGGVNWSPSGLDGLVIDTLVIDPTTAPAMIYAGTGSGLYKSKDGGGSWKSILCCDAVAVVAIDPTAAGTLYAGTLGAGVSKSINGGVDWTPANVGLGDTSYVNALAIDPTAPATLYAATGNPSATGSPGGVFKSINHGKSWKPSGLSSTRVYSLAIRSVAPVTLFAGTSDSGVFKSLSGGADWQAMNSGLPMFGNFVPVNVLVIDPDSEAALYAGTDGSSSFAGSTFEQKTFLPVVRQ
jgi:photosystem II stability/assembly factor-like uncharacterized protein